MFGGKSKVRLLELVVVGLLLVSMFGSVSAQQPEIAIYAYTYEPIVYWDPGESWSDELIVFHNVYETLLRYDPLNDVFQYVLAEAYERSEDGLTWTFYLRKGVKFHTGNEMNAEAVKFSIERVVERGFGPSFIWDPVDRIEVVDKHTVKFHLKYPVALSLVVSSSYAAYIIDPEYADHEWFSQGNECGTGPYEFESHRGKEIVVISKFDEYWGGWEGKHFDKVIFKWVPESSTRRLEVEGGQVDFVNRLPSTEIEALRGQPEVEIVEAPSYQYYFCQFNMIKEGPMGNRLVRKALAYTLPYKDIVEEIMGDYGREPRGVIPYGLWGHSDLIKKYTYSPETAKALLAEAGYPNGGFDLFLIYVGAEENERRIVELWKSKLAELNIDLKLRGLTVDALNTFIQEDRSQDINVGEWWPDYPHPDSILSALWVTEEVPIFNGAYYSNPLFDNLVSKARITAGLDRDEAVTMYAEAQNILMEDVPGLTIVDRENVRAMRASLKGYVDNPAYADVVFWYNCWREE